MNIWDRIIALNGGRKRGALTNFAEKIGRTKSNVSKWFGGQHSVYPDEEAQQRMAELFGTTKEIIMQELKALRQLLEEQKLTNLRDRFSQNDWEALMRLTNADARRDPVEYLISLVRKLDSREYFLSPGPLIESVLEGLSRPHKNPPAGDVPETAPHQSEGQLASGTDRK